MKKKILTVVGARPQFVKAAVLSHAIEEISSGCIQEILLHTGQHYDANMSSQFFRQLGLAEPAYNLEIGSGTHGRQTARMLEGVEAAVLAECPDLVVVYGDTNSTLAGALAAAKLNIPVAHVEAGLRSYRREMPEEINRVMTDHLSSLLFTPTEAGRANLHMEGVNPASIHQVGDVMYDAFLMFKGLANPGTCDSLAALELDGVPYALATLHRQANTDDPRRLLELLGSLRDLSEDIPVVLPLHPRTRARLESHSSLLARTARWMVIDPVGYLEMLALESGASLILTDSGGVQKEAYFAGKACLVLRSETEWTELLESAAHRLWLPGNGESIRQAVAKAEEGMNSFKPGLYGDGTAGRQIASVIKAFLG